MGEFTGIGLRLKANKPQNLIAAAAFTNQNTSITSKVKIEVLYRNRQQMIEEARNNLFLIGIVYSLLPKSLHS